MPYGKMKGKKSGMTKKKSMMKGKGMKGMMGSMKPMNAKSMGGGGGGRTGMGKSKRGM